MFYPPDNAAKYELFEAFLKLSSRIQNPAPGESGKSMFLDVPGLINPIG
jgi:hypothetical protein